MTPEKRAELVEVNAALATELAASPGVRWFPACAVKPRKPEYGDGPAERVRECQLAIRKQERDARRVAGRQMQPTGASSH
jgi:hypothetical protein